MCFGLKLPGSALMMDFRFAFVVFGWLAQFLRSFARRRWSKKMEEMVAIPFGVFLMFAYLMRFSLIRLLAFTHFLIVDKY